MASTFGAAFDALPRDTRRAIISNLNLRRTRYEAALLGTRHAGKVILLGDRPGPGAPTTVGYHHTPFYSTKNSSLWLNRQLAEAGIQEVDLLWYNSADINGFALNANVLIGRETLPIICLGGNAERWLTKHACWTGAYHKVHHPQAWKRFHAGEPYALIPLLMELTRST